MNINAVSQEYSCCREVFRHTKNTRLYQESILPDTLEDVGKLASSRATVFLKSKDIGAHGITAGGEVEFRILYISESRKQVLAFTVTKDFSVDFELEQSAEAVSTQLHFEVTNLQTRTVNPRKLSVEADLCAFLYGYEQGSVSTVSDVEQREEYHIHVAQESIPSSFLCAAAEKSFVVSEQFPIEGYATPMEAILSAYAESDITDCQMLGNKALLKGVTRVHGIFRRQECLEPLTLDFTCPFSQLVECEGENGTLFRAFLEQSAAYFSLTDTIGGGKSLEMELHYVGQLLFCENRELPAVRDCYSNQYALTCHCVPLRCRRDQHREQLRLAQDEELDALPPGAVPILQSASTDNLAATERGMRCRVLLGVLYSGEDGLYSYQQRSFWLEADLPVSHFEENGVVLEELRLRNENELLYCHVSAKFLYSSWEENDSTVVDGIELSEETVDFSTFPSLTLVRPGAESSWELAKKHHSTPEAIEEANRDNQTAVLLIPKAL